MDKLELIIKNLPYISQGIMTTLFLTVVALACGFVVGLALSLLRLYGGTAAAGLTVAYGRIIRGLPLLVIMIIFYLFIADLLRLSTLLTAALALGLHSSAYQAEIFRAAIQSVGSGQMMAARSLGLSRFQALRYVILPQALRLALPAWSNEAAIVLKDSSLAYAIGAAELLRRSEYVSARTYEPLLVFSTCGLIYLLLTMATNRILGVLELKYRIPSGH
ncbi:MAG: amino acid ABC transporter permease [bacterium]|jgi:polar amino acid transport system permease protein